MAGNFKLSTDLNNRKIFLNTFQTITFGPFAQEGNYAFSHNLGYVPSASVWYEAKPGQWWPLSTRQFNDSFSTFNDMVGDYSLTSTSITVTVRNNGPNTSCNIFVRLYLDG